MKIVNKVLAKKRIILKKVETKEKALHKSVEAKIARKISIDVKIAKVRAVIK